MDLHLAQNNMIKQQIRTWDVMASSVLAAFAQINRGDFTEQPELAYADIRLPIANSNEVMLEPKIEARILQALDITTNDDVLEIGTGSGYMTALIAYLANCVDSIEIIAGIADLAKSRLAINNANVIVADALTYQPQKNYDAIIITGSLRQVPEAIKYALKEKGKLFAFIKTTDHTTIAVLMQRLASNNWGQEILFETDIPALVNQPTVKDEFVF